MSPALLLLLSLLCLTPSAGQAAPPPPDASGVAMDGGVEGYVALAVAQSPEVQGAFSRWEAATHRFARARALPEPTVTFGAFVSSVETRVGPQQARLSVQQSFPWPTVLTAGGDAAEAQAVAMQHRLEATTLRVVARVAAAYWSLWEVRGTRQTHIAHGEVLEGLSATVRARVEVGRASLADLQQVDLARARLADAIAGMDEREQAAQATLQAALGVPGQAALPTTAAPLPVLWPAEDAAALLAAALAHPLLAGADAEVAAAEAAERAAAARRLPGVTVGADWILVGPAASPDMAGDESGKDAVMLMAGVKVPLWQRSYAEDLHAARATTDALQADRQALAVEAEARVARGLSAVRDSARRVQIIQGTLLPQAEAAYASLLGSYTAGSGSVAQVMQAQQTLLDLRVDLDRAHADHARAWAALEETCGRPIVRQEVSP